VASSGFRVEGVQVDIEDDAHPTLEVLPVWWQDRSACVGVDPEIFFPSATQDQMVEARTVCSTCSVLPQSRDYADALEEGRGDFVAAREPNHMGVILP
jgi:hypothetical protein